MRETFSADYHFLNVFHTMNEEFDLSKSFELVLTELNNRIEPLLPASKNERRETKIKSYAYLPAGHNPTHHPDLLQFHPRLDLKQTFTRALQMKHSAPGDAVITFNYDASLDRELDVLETEDREGTDMAFPFRLCEFTLQTFQIARQH